MKILTWISRKRNTVYALTAWRWLPKRFDHSQIFFRVSLIAKFPILRSLLLFLWSLVYVQTTLNNCRHLLHPCSLVSLANAFVLVYLLRNECHASISTCHFNNTFTFFWMRFHSFYLFTSLDFTFYIIVSIDCIWCLKFSLKIVSASYFVFVSASYFVSVTVSYTAPGWALV